MSLIVKGQDVINALNNLKKPASLTKIVDYISRDTNGSNSQIIQAVKDILEPGVRFGYIVQAGYKYRVDRTRANDEEINEPTNETSKKDEVKSVMSVNAIQTSNESVYIPKKAQNVKRKQNALLSRYKDDDDEDELNDFEDTYGSAGRKRSRSRSRAKGRSSRRRRRAY